MSVRSVGGVRLDFPRYRLQGWVGAGGGEVGFHFTEGDVPVVDFP